LLSTIDQTRLLISKNTESNKKSQFGQFLTSEKTAAFMANMFPPANGNCQLLDAGAGIGSLFRSIPRSPEAQAELSSNRPTRESIALYPHHENYHLIDYNKMDNGWEVDRQSKETNKIQTDRWNSTKGRFLFGDCGFSNC
jgi:hypothetical protein